MLHNERMNFKVYICRYIRSEIILEFDVLSADVFDRISRSFSEENVKERLNKTGTSKVGAISNAQKAQRFQN